MNRSTFTPLLIAAMLAAVPARGEESHAPPADPAQSARPAGGIRTDFGDVQIDNLGIGRTYNLRDLAGTPMKVTNTGAETVNLLMTVEIPTETMVTERRKELGFQPIPKVDWVSLSQSQFIVPPGESAYTDVVINIPNDPALYGKHFQASIYSRTNGVGLNVGVWSHLMLGIAKSEGEQKQIEENRKRGVVGTMDYTLLPDKLVIQNVKAGQTLDLKKELKRTIMIANSGADPIRLRVKAVPPADTPLGIQTGYEAGDPAWLQVGEKIATVEGSSFADPKLVLALPNDPKLAGKKLMFTLRVEPADPDVVGVTFYGKLYVEVAP